MKGRIVYPEFIEKFEGNPVIASRNQYLKIVMGAVLHQEQWNVPCTM